MHLAGMLAEGERHQRAGRLAEAERAFRAVLAQHPAQPVAQHYLALILKSRGDTTEAERLMRAALRGSPNEPAFHNNLGNLLRGKGTLAEAETCYRAAIALKADYPEAHYNLGIVLKDQGRAEDALAAFRRAVAVRPAYAEALTQCGAVLKNLGRAEDALAVLTDAVAANPQAMEARYYLGGVLAAVGRIEEAIPHLIEAAALRPDSALALAALTDALKKSERFGDAIGVCGMWITLAADDAKPLAVMADLLLQSGDAAAALGFMQRAMEKEANDPGFLLHQARILTELSRVDEAVAVLRRTADLAPGDARVKTHLSDALKIQGRIEEAADQLRAALACDPTNPEAYLALSDTKRFTAGDPLIAQMEAVLAQPCAAGGTPRPELNFALGKAYDDIGASALAFAQWTEGNALRRQASRYDEAANLAHFERVIEAFTPERMAALRGSGCAAELPIFIIGMPRSGSTLCEQILASHSQVSGGGELPHLARSIDLHAGERPQLGPFPLRFHAWTGGDLAAVAERYLARLVPYAQGRPHVTDKMLTNFLLLGFIHLALPRAKVIHVRRDPADNCLSCFSKDFGSRMPQSNALGSIGRYYRAYHALMAHWRLVLPEGAFLDVDYEELVADTEGQTRRMLDYCGLGFEPECLAFHRTQRPVRTASVSQVRQPIYARAVQRWRAYEAHLGPLFEALGDLAPVRSKHG
jgi:tetratricopeptide (TPR) repeat protein